MKKTIVVSVMSSLLASIIFFLFLQPWLEGVPAQLANFITQIYSEYEGMIYGNAALGMRNYVVTAIYITMLTLAWPLYVVSAVVYVIGKIVVSSKSRMAESVKAFVTSGGDVVTRRLSVFLLA